MNDVGYNTVCHFSSGVLCTLGFLDILASWPEAPSLTNFRVQFYRGVLQGNRKRTLRGVRFLSLIAVLAFSTLWMPACGGGSNGGGNPGTPPGTSTVIVTASTGGPIPISHQTQVSLTVQ